MNVIAEKSGVQNDVGERQAMQAIKVLTALLSALAASIEPTAEENSETEEPPSKHPDACPQKNGASEGELPPTEPQDIARLLAAACHGVLHKVNILLSKCFQITIAGSSLGHVEEINVLIC